MTEGKSTVTIPTALYQKIEKEIADSEFKSVEEYIIKTLEEKLPKDSAGEDALSAEEEEKVKERLRALGYMD